jgi:hypothetical protein
VSATSRIAGTWRLPYLYVAGMSYSGSTLLSMLLASHPEISSVGELTGPSRAHAVGYPCSCGEKVADCPFWRSVGDGMHEAGLWFSPEHFDTRAITVNDIPGKLYAMPTGTAFTDTVRDHLLAGRGTRLSQARVAAERCAVMARVITEVEGTTTFVDTSKEWAQIAHLSRRRDLDLRVLHLIRDGRAVAASIMRHKRADAAAAAGAWVRVNQRAERAIRSHVRPERVMTLRYEDFCEKPDEAFARVARFLGVADDFARGSLDPTEFHVLGNAMRTRPVDEIVSDERWRTMLTPTDLETFNRVAGKLNRRYGYESSVTRAAPVSTG